MLGIRVIPCLLLKDKGLVKTVRFKSPKYVGDPINAVRIFNDKECDELVFLDISATNERRTPPFDLIRSIATECFMPFCYGGGIRTVQEVETLFNLGVEKVAICSHAVEDPTFVRKVADLAGRQSVAVCIDVKKDLFGRLRVASNSGKKVTNLDPFQFAIQMEEMGAGEIILNSIDRDGTMQGYDIPLIQQVSRSVNVPVVACGGAGKLDDFHQAVGAGASAVAAGSMFVFTGPHRAVLISYPAPADLRSLLRKDSSGQGQQGG